MPVKAITATVMPKMRSAHDGTSPSFTLSVIAPGSKAVASPRPTIISTSARSMIDSAIVRWPRGALPR